LQGEFVDLQRQEGWKLPDYREFPVGSMVYDNLGNPPRWDLSTPEAQRRAWFQTDIVEPIKDAISSAAGLVYENVIRPFTDPNRQESFLACKAFVDFVAKEGFKKIAPPPAPHTGDFSVDYWTKGYWGELGKAAFHPGAESCKWILPDNTYEKFLKSLGLSDAGDHLQLDTDYVVVEVPTALVAQVLAVNAADRALFSVQSDKEPRLLLAMAQAEAAYQGVMRDFASDPDATLAAQLATLADGRQARPQSNQPADSSTTPPAAAGESADTSANAPVHESAGEAGETPAARDDPKPELPPEAIAFQAGWTLFQSIRGGDALGIATAGVNAVAIANRLSEGALLSREAGQGFTTVGAGLGLASAGVGLFNAIDSGDPLGIAYSTTSLAQQATQLWANNLGSSIATIEASGDLATAALYAEAAGANAAAAVLADVVPILGAALAISQGNYLGAVGAIMMMNPVTFVPGLIITVVSSLFGGLFGGDEEPPYNWIPATGEGRYVSYPDGSIGIEASGTNTHKSTKSSPEG
ncbi:MAG: hypothetical protein ACRDGM_20925, partial [bacterium]